MKGPKIMGGDMNIMEGLPRGKVKNQKSISELISLKADLLPAVNGEGSNELIPSSLAERFAGPSLTRVTGFSSAHRPGLRPITPTAERFGVIAPKATF